MVNMLTNKKNHVFASKGTLQAKNIYFGVNYNSLKEMKLNYLQSDSNITRNIFDHVFIMCVLIIGPFRNIISKQIILIEICETSAVQEALT
jgi:hypothetical protein